MLQGVVFDLDGTLVDSEPVWDRVLRALVEKFGKVYDPAFHTSVLGTSRSEALRRMIEWFDLPTTLDELVPLYDPTFITFAKQTPPAIKPGADALLSALAAASIPIALATGSRHEIVDAVLKAHGWDKLFTSVVCGDDVVNGKPAPDVYTEAARRLNCAIGKCIALEDATNGVASAKASGMKVIGVLDPKYGSDLTAADLVIDSLERVSVESLKAFI